MVQIQRTSSSQMIHGAGKVTNMPTCAPKTGHMWVHSYAQQMQHVGLAINRSCAERDNIGYLHRSESYHGSIGPFHPRSKRNQETKKQHPWDLKHFRDFPILDLASPKANWPHGQLQATPWAYRSGPVLLAPRLDFVLPGVTLRFVKSSGNRLMEPVLYLCVQCPVPPLSSKLSVVSRSSRLPVFNGTSARDYQKQIHTHQARWNNIVCYLTLLMLPSTNRNQWNGPCSPTLKNRRYVQKSTPSLLLMTALKSKAQNHQKQFSERHSLQTNIHALRSAYMLWNNSPDPTNQSPRV